MEQIFENWTAYDDWLIENYNNFDITKVEEIEKKIKIEYSEKKKE